jgi:hypothetical protein
MLVRLSWPRRRGSHRATTREFNRLRQRRSTPCGSALLRCHHPPRRAPRVMQLDSQLGDDSFTDSILLLAFAGQIALAIQAQRSCSGIQTGATRGGLAAARRARAAFPSWEADSARRKSALASDARCANGSCPHLTGAALGEVIGEAHRRRNRRPPSRPEAPRPSAVTAGPRRGQSSSLQRSSRTT